MLEKGVFAESEIGQARNRTWSIGTPGVASEPWPENAPCARLVRDAGMSTRASEVQPEKAEAAMVVRLEQTERSISTNSGRFRLSTIESFRPLQTPTLMDTPSLEMVDVPES